jgi:hypothetical protein
MNILNRKLPPLSSYSTPKMQLKWVDSFMLGECFKISFGKISGYYYAMKYNNRMRKWK